MAARDTFCPLLAVAFSSRPGISEVQGSEPLLVVSVSWRGCGPDIPRCAGCPGLVDSKSQHPCVSSTDGFTADRTGPAGQILTLVPHSTGRRRPGPASALPRVASASRRSGLFSFGATPCRPRRANGPAPRQAPSVHWTDGVRARPPDPRKGQRARSVKAST